MKILNEFFHIIWPWIYFLVISIYFSENLQQYLVNNREYQVKTAYWKLNCNLHEKSLLLKCLSFALIYSFRYLPKINELNIQRKNFALYNKHEENLYRKNFAFVENYFFDTCIYRQWSCTIYQIDLNYKYFFSSWQWDKSQKDETINIF